MCSVFGVAYLRSIIHNLSSCFHRALGKAVVTDFILLINDKRRLQVKVHNFREGDLKTWIWVISGQLSKVKFLNPLKPG